MIYPSLNAIEIITFISGYLSRSLLKNIGCEDCKKALNSDPVSSAYLDGQNKGGLKLSTSSLNNYTQCSFPILDHFEQIILELDFPSKVLAQRNLSSGWDNSFVCVDHSMIDLQRVNSII